MCNYLLNSEFSCYSLDSAKSRIVVVLKSPINENYENLKFRHQVFPKGLQVDFFDDDGWPHYKIKEQLPPLKAGEQSVLMKEALVNYFLEKKYIV